jgi:hypothetical protein
VARRKPLICQSKLANKSTNKVPRAQVQQQPAHVKPEQAQLEHHEISTETKAVQQKLQRPKKLCAEHGEKCDATRY